MSQSAAPVEAFAATDLSRCLAWGLGFRRTIRGRILVAFLLMSTVTAALGVYAVLGIGRAGTLVAKTFDESLMSINYARAAAADFASMRAAFARRWIAVDPEMRTQLDESVDMWRRSLTEDLEIAAQRSQSQRAVRAAANMQRAVANWNDVRQRLLAGSEPDVNWDTLDHYTAIVEQQIDLLVNYTAGDAFLYRQTARSTVSREIYINLGFTLLALLISAAVAWLLARRIIGPVAAASAAAGQIAGGKLDVEIPQGSADELGALLAAMRLMRDNIKTMMQREVEQRRSAQMRLADALENSREGVVLVDAHGRLALANSQAADFMGTSIQLLRPGTPIAELGPLMEKATRAQLPPTGEARLDDGRWLRVSQSGTSDGGSIVVCSDISLLKQQEETLKGINLRLDAALDNMSQGLCLYDKDSCLLVVNRRFCELFGLQREKLQPGMTFRDVVDLCVATGNHPGKTADELIEERRSIGDHTTGTHFVELAGNRVVVSIHRPTSDGGFVATYEDVTERRQAEKRIAYMARHDALTGLPNRVVFGERVDQAIADMGRGSGFAVLSVDVDHFKQVNDTLGHPVGDELLRAIAERLQSCIREVDTVGRLGGDEFAIVQRDVKQPEDAALLARRIIEIAGAPYDINGHRVTIGISLGISLAPGDGSSCEKLLKNSDVALYRAKSDGRGTWRFFEPEMDARLQARLALELDLREALEQRSVRTLLSAALSPGAQQDLRLRGAVALASSGARHGVAGRVHSGRRGDRPDRPARRMGAAAGLRRGLQLAAGRQARGQRFAGPVQERPARAARHFGARVVRAAGAAAGARDHRIGPARQQRRHYRRAACAAPRLACASRWTTSAPATRRLTICAASRSTRSRSISASSAT